MGGRTDADDDDVYGDCSPPLPLEKMIQWSGELSDGEGCRERMGRRRLVL